MKKLVELMRLNFVVRVIELDELRHGRGFPCGIMATYSGTWTCLKNRPCYCELPRAWLGISAFHSLVYKRIILLGLMFPRGILRCESYHWNRYLHRALATAYIYGGHPAYASLCASSSFIPSQLYLRDTPHLNFYIITLDIDIKTPSQCQISNFNSSCRSPSQQCAGSSMGTLTTSPLSKTLYITSEWRGISHGPVPVQNFPYLANRLHGKASTNKLEVISTDQGEQRLML